MDGAEDWLVSPDQVNQVVQDIDLQIAADAEDDDDYINLPVANRCKMTDLFVNMPEYDLKLLFDEDIAVPCSCVFH